MESIHHRITLLYKDMGPAEKRIADFLLQHTQDIVGTSISELAAYCGCGDATVVRFSRKLGFDGYQGLKIGIATELGAASTISSEISREDTCFQIFQKRVHDISTALNYTESVLDPLKLEQAAKAVMKAKRIVIFGLGNSAAIAQDAAHKFLRLGLDAQACSDNHLQAIIASHLNWDCVAIGISHSGASTDIIEAMQLARVGNATTICITNVGESPLAREADIVLFTKSDETRHSILAMSSRIAQLTIFDAIYTYIVLNADKAAVQAIYNTETALKNKKIREG